MVASNIYIETLILYFLRNKKVDEDGEGKRVKKKGERERERALTYDG